MSLILGTIVREEIKISNDYLVDILTEIKHYLALQTSIVIDENQFCLKISSVRKVSQIQTNHTNEFAIPKNFMYLFTHWQRIHVQNQEDLEFFDVSYECLMIIKEYLPSKISIGVQILDELNNEPGLGTQNNPLSLVDFVENFESQKNEQFCRRINSNFKSLVSMYENEINRFHVLFFDIKKIENILYLSQHFYFYKNKLNALKFLAQHPHIRHQQLIDLDEKYLDFLTDISIDEDFRPYSTQLLQKVSIAKEIFINNNNLQTLQENHTQQSSSQDLNNQNDSQSSQPRHTKNSALLKPYKTSNKIQNQKQFRSSNNQKQNQNLIQKINRQPLRQLNKTDRIKQYPIHDFKEDKMQNISSKSLLFQLRQSHSLKRLSLLINSATQFIFNDLKAQHKIKKKILNVCKNFLKQNYSIQNKKYSKQINFDSQYDKNTQISQQQTLQVTRFYQSLQKYFTKKGSFIKLERRQRHDNKKLTQKDQQTIHIDLLNKIRKKIQNQYYCS